MAAMRLAPVALVAFLVIRCGASTSKRAIATQSVPSAASVAAVQSQSTAVASAASATQPALPASPSPSPTSTPTSKPTASPSPTPKPDETGLANAMLLTVNDFPAGWSETPSSSSTPSALDKCKIPDSPGQTGKAETGDFGNGGAASVSEIVAVFDTPKAVSDSLATFTTEADCVVKAINSGALDDKQAAFSGATYGAESFPTFGDQTQAYRVKFHIKAKGQTGFGSEGDAYFDVVYVAVGRAGFSMVASDVFTPFDTTQLQRLVKAATAKLQQSLPTQ